MKTPFSFIILFGIIIIAAILAFPILFPRYGVERDKRQIIALLTSAPLTTPRPEPENAAVNAAAKVWPSVVAVHAAPKEMPMSSGIFPDDGGIFQQLSGRRMRNPDGLGSGIIISPDGYIITNTHVVANRGAVTVKIGETSYAARITGADQVSDIAVLKIDSKGVQLPAASLGDSRDLRVGDWAIAVGNPLDVGTTATMGIISALNRTGLGADGRDLTSVIQADVAVIQTDTAINPGNSGGALANIDGEVIGVNDAIESPTGAFNGIGFAVPINAARRVAASLIRNGRMIYPYLGVSYAPLKFISLPDRRKRGIASQSDDGAAVERVYPGSPADQAGLKANDVILEANNRKIVETAMVTNLIQQLNVGDKVTLLVQRGGQTLTIVVTLRERPATFGRRR